MDIRKPSCVNCLYLVRVKDTWTLSTKVSVIIYHCLLNKNPEMPYSTSGQEEKPTPSILALTCNLHKGIMLKIKDNRIIILRIKFQSALIPQTIDKELKAIIELNPDRIKKIIM